MGYSQVDVVYNDLVWSDEFDTDGAINSNNWFHQTQLPAEEAGITVKYNTTPICQFFCGGRFIKHSCKERKFY
jgi:hypothetical protein